MTREYIGNDSYEYTLSSGLILTLTDEDLAELKTFEEHSEDLGPELTPSEIKDNQDG